MMTWVFLIDSVSVPALSVLAECRGSSGALWRDYYPTTSPPDTSDWSETLAMKKIIHPQMINIKLFTWKIHQRIIPEESHLNWNINERFELASSQATSALELWKTYFLVVFLSSFQQCLIFPRCLQTSQVVSYLRCQHPRVLDTYANY